MFYNLLVFLVGPALISGLECPHTNTTEVTPGGPSLLTQGRALTSLHQRTSLGSCPSLPCPQPSPWPAPGNTTFSSWQEKTTISSWQEKTTSYSWQECGNLCYLSECCHWAWDQGSQQCLLLGGEVGHLELEPQPHKQELASFIGDRNCPVNDCGGRHFENWFQLLSPCFERRLLRQTIPHPELCVQEPSSDMKTKVVQAVQFLNQTVLASPELSSLAQEMFSTVPQDHKQFCPADFSALLSFLSLALMTSPPFLSQAPDHLGCPIQNILLCLLHTQAGRQFFSRPQVNLAMVGMVQQYGLLLSSQESLVVFNDLQYGWQSECAMQELNMSQFHLPDPGARAWGFTSFNHWFTREFKDFKTSRPCASSPTALASVGDVEWVADTTNLELENPLYIKNETYSLLQMFGNTEDSATLAEPFVGGSLVQVFFSATKYHHFHSPTRGTVTHTQHIPGIVYAVDEVNVGVKADLTGGKSNMTEKEKLDLWIDHSATGLYNTELYLAHVATRCLLILDSPDLGGKVALVFIGMVEISSCKMTREVVKGETYEVQMGTELGFFQFGGSSGVIILSRDVMEKSGKEDDIWAGLSRAKKNGGWKVCEKMIDAIL